MRVKQRPGAARGEIGDDLRRSAAWPRCCCCSAAQRLWWLAISGLVIRCESNGHWVAGRAHGHRHKIQHVVWILMENKDYSSVIGPGSAPFINRLARTYGLATNYSAISHPSLPNYIALTSGSDQGISDDSDPSSHRLNVPSIFSQLPGGASRSLEQGMPSQLRQGRLRRVRGPAQPRDVLHEPRPGMPQIRRAVWLRRRT